MVQSPFLWGTPLLLLVIKISRGVPDIFVEDLPSDSGQDILSDHSGGFSTKQLSFSKKSSASGIKSLQIIAVGSQQVGVWEMLSSYQTSTSYDHGGSFLRVVTQEVGYGNLPVARFNGRVLPSSAAYQTDRLCAQGSSVTTSCRTGQTIVGFRTYWRIDGNQAGTFTYQNTSTNAPWNTVSDTVYIR